MEWRGRRCWKGRWVYRTVSPNCVLRARVSPPGELPVLRGELQVVAHLSSGLVVRVIKSIASWS